MPSLQLFLADEQQTLSLGAALAQLTQGCGLLFLQGELGAGKTTLSRGLIHSLGYTGTVKSPTFTLVELYEIGAVRVLHFDLYRLADAEELEFLGIRDYLADDNLCLIEWPQRGQGVLPKADLHIKMCVEQQGRRIELIPQSTRAEHWCAALADMKHLRG